MSDVIQGFALSPAQRRLWLLQENVQGLCCQCTVQLDGDLDRQALRQGLGAAISRHGILRTTFRRRPGIRIPLQVVAADGAPEWREADFCGLGAAALEELAAEERLRPFDLDRGPLLRVALVGLEPRRHALVLTLPALCGDARTLGQLLAELAAGLVAVSDPGSDPVEYVEVAAWQNGFAEEEGAEEALAHWRRPEIAGATASELPGERRPTAGVVQLRYAPVPLGAGTAARLEEAARRCETSTAAVLLAAWHALLWRLTRQDGLVVDVVLDGRKFEEFQAVLGPLSGAVPVPAHLAPSAPFSLLCQELEGAISEAVEGQEHWLIAQASEEPVPRSFGFELESWSLPAPSHGLSFGLLGSWIGGEPFRLKLACRAVAGILEAGLVYDARAFDEPAATLLARAFCSLLEGALVHPDSTIDQLPLLDANHREQIVFAFNRTSRDLPRLPVHRLFEEQAARSPESVAAELEGREITYGELNARANRLGWWLSKMGMGPDRVAALCLSDPLEMLIGLLAVLKAGGAYLPLDPAYPSERLAFTLRDSGAVVLVTRRELLAALAAEGGRTLCLDSEEDAIAAGSEENLPGETDPESLAYVLYTSGSTGYPKGVMVPHRGLSNYLGWAVEAYGAAEGMGAPVHSPMGFDLTVTALFPPLLAGRKVVFIPADQGIEALGAALREREGFSLVKLTPAHLTLLARWLPGEGLERRTRSLVIGGEALSGESLSFWRRHAPHMRLFNEYGPTETVVGCCVYEVPPDSPAAGAVPIGRPIANARLYVLDPGCEPLPEGASGELFIGGAGVARGYLGRPDLTAERFVPDPFGEPGQRMYRTGDLACLRPDGELEYLGRVDRQIKLRGYRIELGEIEAVLRECPGVREAALAVSGGDRLVAYFIPGAEPAPTIFELREHLRRRLPDYMIPSAFVTLDELPLTANGKVDREALPEPTSLRPDLGIGYEAPQTELERQIGEIWRASLRLDQVGIHDNFFDLGGDSFLMFQVFRGVSAIVDRDFPILRMFQHPTIHSLAVYLTQQEEDSLFLLDTARADGRKSSMAERRRRRAGNRTNDQDLPVGSNE